MADGRDEFNFLSKNDVRFDSSNSVRWQAVLSRGVDILPTNLACTSDVNTLKSRNFENLLQPLSSKGYDH